ncbi:hypothetical protein ACIBH1_06350 [Nonomuraea sp. NPDC050663]|uniref:hypothetical protein n=1 Tax=Nonomuraea sp. NPDC050663 TaxID=3364370 RepID=UPI0037958B2F
MIRKLVLALASVALVLTAAPAHASANTASTVRLRTQQIVRFDQLAGQQAWRGSAMNRVAAAAWYFYDNGTFAFNTTNVRTDLYPLRGRYQVSGDKVTFSANNWVRIGGSSAFTEMIGSIDFGSRPPVMRLNWASGAGYGAVVNDRRFGSTASSHYQVILTVAQF